MADLARITVDGKFFRLGGRKFYIKGVTYGPFAPTAEYGNFASPKQTESDFSRIRELGANLIRVYYVPPRWLLDLAEKFELKVLIDIPWPKHLCFFESYDVQQEARQNVRDAVSACKNHPAVFAFSVANEIPPEVVRWSGAKRTAAFIDELINEATRNADFLCFNVYLHERVAFRNYLARLQSLAGEKPLMLGEFGLDSIREGEEHKCEVLSWKIEETFRAGLAGTVVFSFTDDWFRGGQQIEDWAFGLTTR
jgi:O-antigen biosynthesis protein